MVDRFSFKLGAELASYIFETIPDADHQIITWVYFPESATKKKCQASKFAAIELSSGAIGIAFTSYIPDDKENSDVSRPEGLIGKPASSFISLLGEPDALPAERTVSMAVINALSTCYMKEKGLIKHLEFVGAVEALHITKADIVGMVGMFPPLVKPVAKMAKFLHVLELKQELVQAHDGWDVMLDPAILKSCNKIMITGTVMLNGTLHSLLDIISNANIIALIGPTASFLPDPLFKLGFDMIGGSIVVDPVPFKEKVKGSLPWGDSVEKFVIRKENWPA